MPRNFLILYVAREGSTAIVSQLSQNTNVRIPLLEELDLHWIKRFYPGLDAMEAIASVYETGDFDMPYTYGRKNYLSYDPDLTKTRPPESFAIGFKWRPHGSAHELITVLKRHNVVVFYLTRRNFRELVCSLLISEQKIDGKRVGHAQFKVARAGENASELRAKLEAIKITARPLAVFRVAAKRLYHAARLRRILNGLQSAGIDIHHIHYEDFNADASAFVSQIEAKLCVDPAPQSGPERRRTLKKSSRVPAAERVRGHDRFPVNQVLDVTERIYHWLNS